MHVHICYPTNMRYVARVRPIGHRKYQALPARKSFERAMRDLTANFDRRLRKRGDIVMFSDWYDPITVVELIKR